MSDYKTLYNNTLMPERFMCVFAINPTMPKNQKKIQRTIDLRQNCRLKFNELLNYLYGINTIA